MNRSILNCKIHFPVLAQCSGGKADVVFLIDGSSSIDEVDERGIQNYFDMRKTAQSIIDNFNLDGNGNCTWQNK